MRYYITCDYEVSQKTGAPGMFQITSLTDEQSQNCLHLVETGMNYASLNAVAWEIARRTGENIGTIELRQTIEK